MPTPIDADHLPSGEEKVVAVRDMFDAIAPRYDLVNRIMTFRMDLSWRRRTIASLGKPPGAKVLDLACGTGDLAIDLERRGFHVAGIDMSFGMLDHPGAPFPRVQGDACCLPIADRSIDGVTCGFALRNFASLDQFFEELARVVKPGGRIALLDVATPPNPVMRFGHAIYFQRVVPLIGGLLSDRAAYRYLPKSVEYLPAPEQMLQMISVAGFNDVRRTLLSGGIAQLITGTRAR